MKSLIIYFSHAGENWMEKGLENTEIGNTEIVVQKLQKLIDANTFKVEEINPYPYSYHECCQRAKEELQKNERPEIKKTLKNIEQYQTFYIGTPVWYGHMPMPLFTQLEKLNFHNKTIKYFVTHEGSQLGQVPNDIKQICQNAIIEKPIAIIGHNANESDEILKQWIKGGIK